MNLNNDFLLNPKITFLNFGSFGACPRPVFEAYQDFQRDFESEPVQMITVKGLKLLKESRIALANFLNCGADDLVYVPNPSYAVNAIARNIGLNPGDEVLSTNLEYGACDRTWKFYCAEKGAKYVQQLIQFPLVSKEQFLIDFWKGFTEKTKVVFISQITSTTALILPVKEICEEAKKRGLITVVDGAHVPGHIPLNLAELEADFYTGACHKWMMTPKGSSFMYVKPAYQQLMQPLVVSWGYDAEYPSDSQFLDYHQFNGTRDFSAYLCIPAAISYMQENDWWKVADQSKQLVHSTLERMCALMGSKPLAPITSEFIGQMGSIPIQTNDPIELKRVLYEEYNIEIPVMVHGSYVFIRYSINAFNTEEDLNVLADALVKIKQSGLIL
jgi:isopenicillin-N epimerase